MEQAADTEPWGWTAYFDNINCNLHYAEYAVQRLDNCLGSINLVIDQFNDARTIALIIVKRKREFFYSTEVTVSLKSSS